jgi:hypothetical protein
MKGQVKVMEEKEPYIVDGKNIRRIRTSVELYAGQSAKLQAIAKELGYIQTRGVGAGKVGSVSQLMQAIAEGEQVYRLWPSK